MAFNFNLSNNNPENAQFGKWYYNPNAFLPEGQNVPKLNEPSEYRHYYYNQIMGDLFKRPEASFLQKEIFDFFSLITNASDTTTFQKDVLEKFKIFDRLGYDNKQLIYKNGAALAKTLADHGYGDKNTLRSIETHIQQKYDQESGIISQQKKFDASTAEATLLENSLRATHLEQTLRQKKLLEDQKRQKTKKTAFKLKHLVLGSLLLAALAPLASFTYLKCSLDKENPIHGLPIFQQFKVLSIQSDLQRISNELGRDESDLERAQIEFKEYQKNCEAYRCDLPSPRTDCWNSELFDFMIAEKYVPVQTLEKSVESKKAQLIEMDKYVKKGFIDTLQEFFYPQEDIPNPLVFLSIDPQEFNVAEDKERLIEKTFRKFSLKWHPDKHIDGNKEFYNEKIDQATKAKEMLMKLIDEVNSKDTDQAKKAETILIKLISDAKEN